MTAVSTSLNATPPGLFSREAFQGPRRADRK
jgi:hypothetical protein